MPDVPMYTQLIDDGGHVAHAAGALHVLRQFRRDGCASECRHDNNAETAAAKDAAWKELQVGRGEEPMLSRTHLGDVEEHLLQLRTREVSALVIASDLVHLREDLAGDGGAGDALQPRLGHAPHRAIIIVFILAILVMGLLGKAEDGLREHALVQRRLAHGVQADDEAGRPAACPHQHELHLQCRELQLDTGWHGLHHPCACSLGNDGVEALAIIVGQHAVKCAARDWLAEVRLQAIAGVHDRQRGAQHHDDVAHGAGHRGQGARQRRGVLQLCVLLAHAPHRQPLLSHVHLVAPRALELHHAYEDHDGNGPAPWIRVTRAHECHDADVCAN
mmetsp:Transcript_74406/g.208882  ORF Transcript_74406/g.208882 Transcript_74406/m.208882 type:complete len:332 (-) Transcript_74406:583-1578(-)